MSKNTFVEGSFDPVIKKHIGKNEIPLICVYKNPSDFPGKYAARLFAIRPGIPCITRFVKIADTYEEIAMSIPFGFTKMGRSMRDDPCIMESWV